MKTVTAYEIRVRDMLDQLTSERLKAVIHDVALERPEAMPEEIRYPEPRTGRVGPLPIRAVTEIDARVIATTLRGYIDLHDRLRETLGTTAMDDDIRDRLERVLLELDVPA